MINSKPVLNDYILTIDNVITDQVCKKVVKEYKECKEWNTDDNIRKIDISFDQNIINENFGVRQNIDELILCSVSRVIFRIRTEKLFDRCGIEHDSGYNLLKINGECSFKEEEYFTHPCKNVLTCFIGIDDNENHRFSFFGGDTQVSLKKGSAIIFPSNILFPYEIISECDNDKQFIVTWLR